jgi:hypothetical protein
MRNKVLQIFFITGVFLVYSHSANSQISGTSVGTWNFKCTYAPAGFDTGIIDIHKDSVFTTFSGSTYKFPSLWVKMKKDTLAYNVDINGDEVLYLLKLENRDTLNGKAVSGNGVSPLILTKNPNHDLKDPKAR